MSRYDVLCRTVLELIERGRLEGKTPAVVLLGEQEYWTLRHDSLMVEAQMYAAQMYAANDKKPNTFYGVQLIFTDDPSLLEVKMHSPIVKPPR
jgi:hypothetical protein